MDDLTDRRGHGPSLASLRIFTNGLDHAQSTFAEPPRAVRAALGWPAVRAASAEVGVAVDARTGQCGWDGRPVQYDLVVDDLAYLELRRPPTDAPPS